MFKFNFAPPKPQVAVSLGIVPVGKCVTLKLAGKQEQVIVLSKNKDNTFVLRSVIEGEYRTDSLSNLIPVQSVVGEFSHFAKAEKRTNLHGLDHMLSENGQIDGQYVFGEIAGDVKDKLVFIFGDRSGQSFEIQKDVPTVNVDIFIQSVEKK